MKKVLRKRNFVTGIMILIVVSLGVVFASDVIVKEGALKAGSTVEGEKFKSTGCTASGTKAIAFGEQTTASGNYSTAMGWVSQASAPYSTAMGYETTASGNYGTAMGNGTTASGLHSTAMGYQTTASGTGSIAMGYNTTASGAGSIAMGYNTTASGILNHFIAMGYNTTASGLQHCTAIGRSFTNDVADSFAVGYGQKDFSVKSGEVNVYGKLTVDGDFDPKTLELEVQERNGVIERYEKYVPDGKKSGVVYINSETKKIEIYYPCEGVIRNIQGEIIHSLPSIRINEDFETYYVFDTLTGQVVERKRAIYDKYRVKEDIEFDSSTGQFIDLTTKEIVPKEEAIELYR